MDDHEARHEFAIRSTLASQVLVAATTAWFGGFSKNQFLEVSAELFTHLGAKYEAEQSKTVNARGNSSNGTEPTD